MRRTAHAISRRTLLQIATRLGPAAATGAPRPAWSANAGPRQAKSTPDEILERKTDSQYLAELKQQLMEG